MSCQIPQRKKGFTLIEILIVLVIISIMTGLLITVIDPVRQRQRARDGTVVSTTNKIVAAITAYHSATGGYPSCDTLMGGEIQNAVSAGCVATSNGSEGSFDISGIMTPETCADGGLYSSTGSAACSFRYENNTSGVTCLGIKLNLPTDLNGDGTSGVYLIWDSSVGSVVDSETADCDSI